MHFIVCCNGFPFALLSPRRKSSVVLRRTGLSTGDPSSRRQRDRRPDEPPHWCYPAARSRLFAPAVRRDDFLRRTPCSESSRRDADSGSTRTRPLGHSSITFGNSEPLTLRSRDSSAALRLRGLTLPLGDLYCRAGFISADTSRGGTHSPEGV